MVSVPLDSLDTNINMMCSGKKDILDVSGTTRDSQSSDGRW